MELKKHTETDVNKHELEISVDGAVFAAAINKVYKRQCKKFNVPGFRKGKAPRGMIERLYGKDVFYDDAMQDCYPEALEAAAKEAEIKIVAVNTLEALEASDKGFTFKAAVVVEPAVEIDGYKGIEISPKSTEVTDDLINEEIDKVRDRNSRMVTVDDRPAQNGDIAVIDYEGSIGGVPFDGGKGENFSLSLGSGQFIPGFEEQVYGHNTGDEFSISITFPEDYQAKEFAGKEAEFKIKLHEIKEKVLPELDDDFVKDVSLKDSVDEYKAEIKETVKTRLEEEAKKDKSNQIAEKLISLVRGEIPEEMYDNKVNEMIREFDMRLRSQGLEMNTYLQYMNMDSQALKNMYKPEAEKRVKLRLALEKIAELEKLQATEEEINAEYEKLAEAYKMETEKVKSIVDPEGLALDIKAEKALNLVEASVVEK